MVVAIKYLGMHSIRCEFITYEHKRLKKLNYLNARLQLNESARLKQQTTGESLRYYEILKPLTVIGLWYQMLSSDTVSFCNSS